MVRRSWLRSLLIVTCIHCQRRRSSRVVQMLKVRPLQEAIVSSSAHNSKSRSLFTSHVTYTFSLEQMQKTSLLGFFLLFLQLYSGISTNMANSGNSVQPRGKIFNRQNSFSSVKYLHNTTRSWASNEQSLVNFGDGHSALVTCHIAGVDME